MCTLLWLGFVPDDLTDAPSPAVERLAAQLGMDAAALTAYGGWQDRTLRDHLREVLERLQWRTAGGVELKEFDDFLLARGLEHDSPTVLRDETSSRLRS